MGKRDLSMITICVQGTTDHEITYYLIDAPLLFRVTPPIGWMLVIFVVNDAWISSPLKVMVIGCVFSSKNYELIFSIYFFRGISNGARYNSSVQFTLSVDLRATLQFQGLR